MKPNARGWAVRGATRAWLRAIGACFALALATSAAASSAAADRCLERLAGVSGSRSVVPVEHCPDLVDTLFPDNRPAWVSEPMSVTSLRATARSLASAPTTEAGLVVDQDRVGEIVAQTHVPAVPEWVRWFREWLEREQSGTTEAPEWLRGLADWVEANGEWLLAAMQGVLALTIVLLLAWILVGVRWPRWRWPHGGRGASAEVPTATGVAPRQFETIGELDPTEQVPALLAWLVEEWDRSARLPGARRMTDGQIARRLAREADSGRVGAFRELADTAQAALYGGRMPDSETRQRCFRIAGDLAGGRD